MRAHQTKTKYTILSINTCKISFQPLDVVEPNIFYGSILSKSPSQSLGCSMSENAPSPLPPLKTDSWSILSRCPITRERVTTQSGGVQSNPEYRQSKLRYPLSFTVIGCLHKQKDPIKPKDLMYCSIYLTPLFRFYSLFNFSQKGVKTWDGQEFNFTLHLWCKLKYKGWYKTLFNFENNTALKRKLIKVKGVMKTSSS